MWGDAAGLRHDRQVPRVGWIGTDGGRRSREGAADAWGLENKKPALQGSAGFEEKAGDGLLSHHLSVAVPSALQGLTAVFGMGTGVAPAR